MEQIMPDDPRTDARRLAWVIGVAALFSAFAVNAMGIGREGLGNVRFVLFLALTLVGVATTAYALLLTFDIMRNPPEGRR